MAYGEFVDLILCDKIASGALIEESTDDEEMIPMDLR